MQRPVINALLCSVLLAGAGWAGEKPDIHGGSAKARAAARQFLAENAKQEGVINLPSGLQYKVIESGSGIKPRPGDRVTVEYRGTLIDGSEFESSYPSGAPGTFWLEDTIPGLREALQRMEEGARWEVYIPAGLAEGKQVARAGHVLVYDVNLISVIPMDASETPGEEVSEGLAREKAPVAFAYLGQGASSAATGMYPRGKRVGPDADYAFLEDNAGKGGVIVLPSGLQYKILRNGSGASPQPDDTVVVDYRGWLPDGQAFDSSYRDAAPATIRLDKAIAGWQEALPRMEEGARWELYVPPELGYQAPEALAGRTLIFEVELLAIIPPHAISRQPQATPNEPPRSPRR